jgi:hypothetical protein
MGGRISSGTFGTPLSDAAVTALDWANMSTAAKAESPVIACGTSMILDRQTIELNF